MLGAAIKTYLHSVNIKKPKIAWTDCSNLTKQSSYKYSKIQKKQANFQYLKEDNNLFVLIFLIINSMLVYSRKAFQQECKFLFLVKNSHF